MRSIVVVIASVLSCGRPEASALRFDGGVEDDAGATIDGGSHDGGGDAGMVSNPDAGSSACANIVITDLRAAPETVEAGQPSTLTWSATNARGCLVEPGGVDLAGGAARVEVRPNTSTTFTVSCYGTACLGNRSEWVVRAVSVSVRPR